MSPKGMVVSLVLTNTAFTSNGGSGYTVDESSFYSLFQKVLKTFGL